MQFRLKTDVTWSRIFWCDFERQKIAAFLISLFDTFLIYFDIFWYKIKIASMSLSDSYLFDVLFQGNFVPSWNLLGDYTLFKNIDTGRYLIWSDLLVCTGFLGKYFLEHCWGSVEEASIFSKLQAYESICCGFLLLLTWNNS